MPKTWFNKAVGLAWIVGVGLGLTPEGRGEAESRRASRWSCTRGSARWERSWSNAGVTTSIYDAKEKVLRWDPAKTAIIICDMWDQHWCRGATRRVGELAPAMNRAVAAARAKGVLIIHAPSSCMDAYKDHPARKRAQAAPKAANLPVGHLGLVQQDPGRGEGCLSDRPVRRRLRRRARVPAGFALEKAGRGHRDPATRTPSATRASRSGTCSRAGGSTTSLLMGVHTNMCVLGRPFGLRQLVLHGKNAVLVRDLTDTMYNSRSWPYVSHFRGHRADHRAHREVRRAHDRLDRPDRSAAVHVPARQSPPRRLPDRRGRVQDRDDLAGVRPQGARAAGDPLHVHHRRPEAAARLPRGRSPR